MTETSKPVTLESIAEQLDRVLAGFKTMNSALDRTIGRLKDFEASTIVSRLDIMNARQSILERDLAALERALVGRSEEKKP